MKRLAGLTIAWGLVLLALAPMAAASYQVASASPASGPPGTAVTVIVSGFTGGITVEAHEGSAGGALLGTAATNASGIAGIPITIPTGAAPGTFTIFVCGVGSGIGCGTEFSEQTTTTFSVTAPPTTTTTTTTAPPPPDTTSPPPGTTPTTDPTEPGVPCVIPDGAIHVDFDGLSTGSGFLADPTSPLYRALDGTLRNSQFHHSSPGWFTDEGRLRKTFYAPKRTSDSIIADNPARDLWTSSPPNVLRSFDIGIFSIDAWDTFRWLRSTDSDSLDTTVDVWQMNGQLDYVGFNVGFGHFGEGFDTPDELVVELVVQAEPIQEDDGTIILGAYWDTVSVTLGPGPQPVTTCLMAVNTIGPTDRWTAFHFDIRPKDSEGRPVHIPVDIDDFFYGVYAPPIPMDGGDLPIPSTIPEAAPEPMPDVTIPGPGELPDPSSDWPLRIAFGIAGLILGAGSLFAFKK